MSTANDRAITQQVNQKLSMRGVRSPCRVDVQTKNGDVTLTGMIQYPHQRAAALQAAGNITGVRRVIDQLKVIANIKRSSTQ